MATDGFVRLPNWLLDDSDMTLHELAVYIVLLRFRDPKTGKCFPGLSTIADRARLSRRTVIRAIESLEAREVIRVTRRSTIQVNQSNVYEVSVANETPQHIWEISARGRRIPRRTRPSDSESSGPTFTPDPSDSQALPGDSEALPSDSQSPPPVTPSHPKKIQATRSNDENHEQTLRPTLASGRANEFSFDEVGKVTEKQLTYLHDLHIHLTGAIPNSRSKSKWAALTLGEAQQLIGQYLRQIPRYDAYEGPESGTPAYAALTPIGQQWADNGFIPDILEVA